MEKKIKIVKDGPYIVQGDIPIFEKIIAVKDGNCYWKDGRELPQAETYSLCRCGKSNNAPFCDGSHKRFDGMELADTDPYDKRAKLIEGPTIDLKDDRRCAKAGFCHRRDGSTWELLEKSDDPEMRNEFIRAACECPTGRTVAIDKDGTIHEDKLDPSIYIVQDPSNNVSGGSTSWAGYRCSPPTVRCTRPGTGMSCAGAVHRRTGRSAMPVTSVSCTRTVAAASNCSAGRRRNEFLEGVRPPHRVRSLHGLLGLGFLQDLVHVVHLLADHLVELGGLRLDLLT